MQRAALTDARQHRLQVQLRANRDAHRRMCNDLQGGAAGQWAARQGKRGSGAAPCLHVQRYTSEQASAPGRTALASQNASPEAATTRRLGSSMPATRATSVHTLVANLLPSHPPGQPLQQHG